MCRANAQSIRIIPLAISFSVFLKSDMASMGITLTPNQALNSDRRERASHIRGTHLGGAEPPAG